MAWTGIGRRVACVGAAGCLIAGAGSVGASGTAAVTAAPHNAASHLTLQSVELTGKTKVVTSRHDHRTLRLDVTYFPHGGNFSARPQAASHPSADLSVTLATKGNTDSNQWIFKLPGAAFSASPTKGTGRLATGMKIAPYGTIHLTMKPIGKLHTDSICAEDRTTSRAVTLSGHLLFNTSPRAPHSLGKVGSRRRAFSLHATITGEYNKPNSDPKCDLPPDGSCPSAVTVQYFSPEQTGEPWMGFLTTPHASYNALSGFRNTPLTKPAGAQRIDTVNTRASAIAITAQTQGTSVTVTADGPHAAGSATLSDASSPETVDASYCKPPSTETYYDSALAPDPTLAFHNQLGGSFAVPNITSSGIYFTYQPS